MDVATTSTLQTSNKQQAGPAVKSLGKDEFLRLFTQQLKAQSPLNPMDSTGFTAQLAQFSSLEQLTNINTQLKDMVSYQSSLQNTMTTSLIGKKVKIAGNAVTLDKQADLSYSLSGAAAKVTVSVYDAAGALVRKEEMGGQTAGSHTLVWDGKDQDGATVPAGQYTFAVEAVDANGGALSATTLTSGTVTGLLFENNVTYLSINGTDKVKLGDIMEIGGA